MIALIARSKQFLSGRKIHSLHPSWHADSTVEHFAQQPLEELSMHQMIEWGRTALHNPANVLKSARHVQRELPKRRLLDLQLLPYVVVTNPHIKSVYDGYRRCFDELRTFPLVHSSDENEAFSQLLRQHVDEHAVMLDRLATGLRECKNKQLVGPCLQLDSFFDSMLHSRISRRIMAEQHLHISTRRPGYIGIICTDLGIKDAIECAAQKTRQICIETFGVAPEVIISGDAKAAIQYIPTHLDYMLFELLKNAARAVVEAHSRPPPQSSDALPAPSASLRSIPPVHVKICNGAFGLTVRISDQGGGVPPQLMRHIWSYGFSTVGMDDRALASWLAKTPSALAAKARHAAASSRHQDPGSEAGSDSPDGPDTHYLPSHQPLWGISGVSTSTQEPSERPPVGRESGGRTPQDAATGGGMSEGLLAGLSETGSLGNKFRMAGLGFGLPLSRLYARYFEGGDLTLKVIPGYGTDAYLTVKHLDEREWSNQFQTASSLDM